MRTLTLARVIPPVVYLTGLALGRSGRDCMPSPPRAGHVARKARRASDRVLTIMTHETGKTDGGVKWYS